MSELLAQARAKLAAADASKTKPAEPVQAERVENVTESDVERQNFTPPESNAEVIKAVFAGVEHVTGQYGWATSFEVSPSNADGRHWHGHPVDIGNPQGVEGAHKNHYFTLCVYQPDDKGQGRRESNFGCAVGLMLDDVGTKGKIPGLKPSMRVETSPGNEQWTYLFDKPVTDIALLKSIIEGLIARAYSDPNAKSPTTRYGRAPFASNTKTDPPHPCKLLAFDDHIRYTPEQLIDGLGLDIGRVGAVTLKRKSINDEVLEDGTYSPPQSAPADFELIKGECEAVRWAAAPENQASVSRAPWLALLSITKHCQDGDELVHEISEHHPEYDEGKTEYTAESLTGGPAKCETFASSDATTRAACERCKHRGKITTPLQLGKLRPVGQAVGQAFDIRPEAVELNKRFGCVVMGSDYVVMDFLRPVMTGQGVKYELGVLGTEAFIKMHAGQFITLKDAEGNEKAQPLGKWWLGYRHRRQYEAVVFAPGAEVPPNILNLYTGYAVPALEGDVSLWLAVLAAVVPDPEIRAYVLKWYAWKIQNPGGVPDTVLIFTGPKGGGKNSLNDPVVAIFGKHAMFTGNPELIVGRFNFHLMDKCLVVLDEAVFMGDPRQQDRIKSIVTAKETMYEPKGLSPVRGVNRAAFVLLTNHTHVWAATEDERRAVVVEAGQSLKGQKDLWTRYHQWVEGPGPAALLHYLLKVDLTGFNPRAIPKGDALRRQIALTAMKDPAVAWWSNCLSEGRITFRDGSGERHIELNDTSTTELERSSLRQSYETSAGARQRGAGDWQGVYGKLGVWCGGIETVRRRIGQQRVNRDVLPELPTLIERFQTATGVTVA